MEAIFEATNRRGPFWRLHWLLERRGPIAAARGIRRFVQRGHHGLADEDIGELGSRLALLIRDGVARHRATVHTYPVGLDEREWDRRLSEIVDGFDAALQMMQPENEELDAAGRAELESVFELGSRRFAEHLIDIWD